MRRSGLIALSVAGSLTLHAFGVVTINEYNSDKQLIGTRTIGTAAWSPALGPHTLENVGATTIHVVSVEIKDTIATSISPER